MLRQIVSVRIFEAQGRRNAGGIAGTNLGIIRHDGDYSKLTERNENLEFEDPAGSNENILR